MRVISFERSQHHTAFPFHGQQHHPFHLPLSLPVQDEEARAVREIEEAKLAAEEDRAAAICLFVWLVCWLFVCFFVSLFVCVCVFLCVGVCGCWSVCL